jgi:hypothetical protein
MTATKSQTIRRHISRVSEVVHSNYRIFTRSTRIKKYHLCLAHLAKAEELEAFQDVPMEERIKWAFEPGGMGQDVFQKKQCITRDHEVVCSDSVSLIHSGPCKNSDRDRV